MDILGGAAMARELRWPAAFAVTSKTNFDRSRISKVCFRGNFADEGHLRYYGSPVKCGGKKEEKTKIKRREKLIKGLVGLQAAGGLDLPAIAGGQIQDGDAIIVDRVADALLARLSLLQAEEKEMKKRRKEERKAAMKAATVCEESSSSSSSSDEDEMNTKTMIKPETKLCSNSKNLCQSEDSSSSSSSSESDCEEQTRLTVPMEKLTSNQKLEQEQTKRAVPIKNNFKSNLKVEEDHTRSIISMNHLDSKPEDDLKRPIVPMEKFTSNQKLEETRQVPAMAADRIEVCIGGKCKKSGAIELMEEFQRRVGEKADVVGCKCLGKCKQAPSVRLRSAIDASSRASISLGVGIQDVGAIVANLFAEDPDLGLNPA